ncbi:MAG: hypothetical protein ACXVLQ_14100 [Bacteriovorax sp.]
MNLSRLSFVSVFLFVFFQTKAHAYPTYIRLNYTSCLACHQSVEGGGPLTPYGKGIAYAESFLGGEYSPSKTSNVFNLNGKMEHSVEARLMALDRLYDYNGKKQRIFPMQLDYTNGIKWRKDLRQEVTLAVAPNTARLRGVDGDTAKKSSWTDRVYLRTFKLDYSYDKNNHFVLGGSNLPLGLRLVDHTAYVRERNRLGVNDVPVQAQYLRLSKEWQQSYFLFAPNPSDNISNREYGFATKQEFFPLTNFALGPQILFAQGKSINRGLLGVFSKWGKGPVAILAEMDYTKRELEATKLKFDQWTSLIETHYFIKDYLRTSLGFQVLRVNNPFKEKEELYTFDNEFKLSSHFSFILEYRQKSTDLTLEKTIFGQVFLNWW